MNLKIAQDAKYQGNDQWKWSVWLEGTDQELDQVQSVIYTLHPTFPKPVQVKKDPKKKFRLDALGWGEFQIQLAIRMKTGDVRQETHWLRLQYPEGEKKKRATHKDPVIFLTSSAADGSFVTELKKALKERHVTVLTNEDASTDLPPDESIRQLVDQANASIAVVSNCSSPWVTREVDYIRERHVPVIPIVIGEKTKTLVSLEHVDAIRITDASDVHAAAEKVWGEVQSRAIWG